MKKLVLALIFSVIPLAAKAADSYGVCPPERFQISELHMPGAGEKTVRFDRVCGAIEILGTDHTGKTEWQALDVPSLPGCVSDAHIHYRLFAQQDHVFIINTDVKTTWELDPAKMTWRQM